MTPGPCDGCLGSERCWVCLGPGVIELSPGVVQPCVRCVGSGRCFICQEIPVALPLPKPRRWTLRLVPSHRSSAHEAEAAS